MDDKVNYTLVGSFVVVLGAALVAAVLWLAAGLGGKKQLDSYQSIVTESVAGLNVDAPVKYLGVDVGKVSAIVIDPQNSRQVILRLAIEHGTPVKRDSEAVLKTQGLTGIAYIELSGGSAGSPPLVPTEDGPVPTIASKPSLSTRVETVLTNVLGHVDSVSANLNKVFDADNQAALRQTLADVATLARAVASQQAALSAGIADAARTARNSASASERFGPTLDRIAAAAAGVEKLAQVATLASERAGRSVDAAASGVQQITVDTVPALNQLLGELSELAGSLQRLSDQTERNPNSLLLGAPKLKAGPGEKETR